MHTAMRMRLKSYIPIALAAAIIIASMCDVWASPSICRKVQLHYKPDPALKHARTHVQSICITWMHALHVVGLQGACQTSFELGSLELSGNVHVS